MTRMQRREVLKAAAAAAVAPIVLPSRLFGAAARSEQLKIAVIGLGGRARGVIGDGLRCPDYRLAAVCDIFKPRVDSYVAQFNKDHADAPIKGYTRISEMLDREKLDGVMVQTTTHARAWCVIQCLKRGINTYIEKPMCLTIEEGRAMVDAARKHKCVTQVGTQQRSIPLNNWACDLIQGGAILITHCYMRPKGRDRQTGGAFGNSGDGVWEKLVRRAPNIFLVVSGHVLGVGRQVSVNEAGLPVHETLVDYQGLPNGGDGWLRIMRFIPSEDKIEVRAYSPLLDETMEDQEHTFSLDYSMTAPALRKAG